MKIGIAGTGPAALMAGSQLALQGHEVTFFEHRKAAGRKFLVAGHGGFNLSHAESKELFLSRYSHEEIRNCVRRFGSVQLVEWLKFIGIETYEGSTGKIFPVPGIKPIQVLKAWLNWLERHGAVFLYEHRMTDFSNDGLLTEHQGNQQWHHFDRMVLALGGGSWAKTGSDGQWTSLLASKSIEIVPLRSSNAGMNYTFRNLPETMAGTVIKNVVLSHGELKRPGEITLTDYGLEGGPVYFLNASFRKHPEIPVCIDFKPQWDLDKIREIIRAAKNPSEGLKSLKLSKAAILLLKSELTKDAFTNPEMLAAKVKALPLVTESLRPMDEAISTSGGISWEEVDAENLSLRKFPNVRVCGEILDWDAPTGGYLLQACFATGFCAGN